MIVYSMNTYPVCDPPLHRNRAEITVLVCEQNRSPSIRYGLRASARRIRCSVNKAFVRLCQAACIKLRNRSYAIKGDQKMSADLWVIRFKVKLSE